MKRITTVELHKQDMKFSAGHFTIFSATERETLHGHNYNVYAALTTLIDDNGLSFDYRHYKRKLLELCRSLNRTFLLPENSKYLQLEKVDEYLYAYFNDEKIPFLQKDVTIVPVTNITVEELAYWFVQQLIADKQELSQHHIQKIEVKIFSAPGQSGSATWEKDNDA